MGSAGSLIPERPWLIAIPKRPGVLSLSLSLSSSVSVSIPLSIPDTLLYPFPFSTHSPSLPIPLFSTHSPSLPIPLFSTQPLLYPSSLSSLPFFPCLHSCLTLPPLPPLLPYPSSLTSLPLPFASSLSLSLLSLSLFLSDHPSPCGWSVWKKASQDQHSLGIRMASHAIVGSSIKIICLHHLSLLEDLRHSLEGMN